MASRNVFCFFPGLRSACIIRKDFTGMKRLVLYIVSIMIKLLIITTNRAITYNDFPVSLIFFLCQVSYCLIFSLFF